MTTTETLKEMLWTLWIRPHTMETTNNTATHPHQRTCLYEEKITLIKVRFGGSFVEKRKPLPGEHAVHELVEATEAT